MKKAIRIEVDVSAPVEKIWYMWTAAEHITEWHKSSDLWQTPCVSNNLY